MPALQRYNGRRPLLRDWLFGPLEPETTPETVDDDHLSTVHLPHNAAELSWKDWDPASWERTWLYRRRFTLGADTNTRLFLRFEGALTTARPTVNGYPLPVHAGGYTPFQYEITEYALADNVLNVVVDGSYHPDVPPNWGPDEPSSTVDFCQPAGLYREVYLISLPLNHVTDVFAKPVDVLDDTLRSLEVHCELDLAQADRELLLKAELSRDGVSIAEASTHLPGLPAGRQQILLHLGGLGDIELWSPGSPTLYDVTVTLFDGGTPVHEYAVRTGFREARFELTGFYLNGERMKLFGLSRHHLYPYAGAAMPARVQRKDVELLRNQLNCNMIRCSTYPHHESFLDACDEAGVLVWDEPPGWQYLGEGEWLENSYRDVRDMILRDRNHPSVVLWAARLNETPGNADFYSRTQKLAKALDDSRQTTGAMLAVDHATTDFQQDVFSYNDYAASTGPDGLQQPELLPPRTDLPYLVSEAVGTLSGPAKFYRRTDSQAVQQGQALAHGRVHNLAGADDRYTGVLGWVGIDYQSRNGNIDRGIKWPGVIDVFRVPKRGAAIYQAQVDPYRRAVIAPSFYWDFHPDGPVTELGARAAIWSNLDRLEVFLDDRHHASLRPARGEFPFLQHAPFFADFSDVGPTDLRIDGYLGDDLVLTRRFSADRGADRISLTVDDPELVADGSDATRVEFRTLDRYGSDRSYVDGDLTLHLDGPAVLVGSNPFPLAEAGGAGAVWLRTVPEETGTVRLTAEHIVLGSAEVSLTVVAPD